MNQYLQETGMLDFRKESIQALLAEKGWMQKDEFQRIKSIYDFIRDEIAFGYNIDDTLSASAVLRDGYGQCNTKGTLLMALLRAAGIPCRLHGFTIDKKLQKGAMTGLIYLLAPRSIVHSWVEVQYDGNWYNLEGFILDRPYLKQLQRKFRNVKTNFCGYGVATDNFQHPQIDWNGNDTYIQKEGINHDYGIFDAPDEFFQKYQQQLPPIKKWLFQTIGRKVMNSNVKAIRCTKTSPVN